MFCFKRKANRSSVLDNDGKVKKRESGQRDLEMNHSHYLMLDDGTTRHYTTKDYRTRLAIHMARLQHEDDVAGMYISLGKSILRSSKSFFEF